jgi:hypothetical protein
MDAKLIAEILELHRKWLKDVDGGKQANLTGADLTGANLTGADLYAANLTGANLTGADLTIFPGLFLLRLQPPDAKLRAWKFVRADGGSPIQENRIIYVKGKSYSIKDGDSDERIQCAAGLNVATLPWCLRESNKDDDLIVEVEFQAKDILAIPFGTDGKFRVSKLKVIRMMTKKKAEELMRGYLKPYGKKE